MKSNQPEQGPKHLFVLSPHSSGSTAMTKLLATSPNVTALPFEGQFMPDAQPLMRTDPWNPKVKLDWPKIKTVWEASWDLTKPIRLEKSPPNILRAAEMVKYFENPFFIIMVRNPYAYCEGTRRRNHFGMGYGKNASYTEIAEGWVRECRQQIKNIRQLPRTLAVTYEEFTEDTEGVVQKLLAFMPELVSLDMDASFWIHSLQGALKRPVVNLNDSQIARLSHEDIVEITAVLRKHSDVMKYFGYELLTGSYHPLEKIRMRAQDWYKKHILRRIQRYTHHVKHWLG
ncbi:MAG: hypothetical protein Kow0080_02330 [Candidatus Promineifilaceae bacterium]